MINVSDLRVIPNECFTISKENMEKIKKIISEDNKFLETRRIVADMSQNGLVLLGTITVNAIKLLGMAEIPETWVIDASQFTDEEKQMYKKNEWCIEALHFRDCTSKPLYIENETAKPLEKKNEKK